MALRELLRGFLASRQGSAPEAVESHPDDDRLAAFEAGALAEAESAAIISHLSECSRCRRIITIQGQLSSSAVADEVEDDVVDEDKVPAFFGQLIPPGGALRDNAGVAAYQDAKMEPAENEETERGDKRGCGKE